MAENSVIGEVSSAIVYKWTLEGKFAAVRKFRQNLSIKSIPNAVNKLTELHHINVAEIRGFSQCPGAILYEYCEVEFVKNGIHVKLHNLKNLITMFNDHNYFNFKEWVNYCMQACHGLTYFHSKNIIHKDLKPSNFLIALENIIVKRADFNEVASFKDTITSTTTTSRVKGITMYTGYPKNSRKFIHFAAS